MTVLWFWMLCDMTVLWFWVLYSMTVCCVVILFQSLTPLAPGEEDGGGAEDDRPGDHQHQQPARVSLTPSPGTRGYLVVHLRKTVDTLHWAGIKKLYWGGRVLVWIFAITVFIHLFAFMLIRDVRSRNKHSISATNRFPSLYVLSNTFSHLQVHFIQHFPNHRWCDSGHHVFCPGVQLHLWNHHIHVHAVLFRSVPVRCFHQSHCNEACN